MRQIPEAFKNFAKEKRHKTSQEKVNYQTLKNSWRKSSMIILGNYKRPIKNDAGNAPISERNSNVFQSYAHHRRLSKTLL